MFLSTLKSWLDAPWFYRELIEANDNINSVNLSVHKQSRTTFVIEIISSNYKKADKISLATKDLLINKLNQYNTQSESSFIIITNGREVLNNSNIVVFVIA